MDVAPSKKENCNVSTDEGKLGRWMWKRENEEYK